jgi:RNA-binding protein YhbY
MSVDLYWDNDEQTIVLCEFSKGWTWEALFGALNKIKTITQNRDVLVGAIVDMSKGLGVPNGSLFSPETRDKAKQMLQMSADGKGPIAIVGANGVIQLVAKAFALVDKNALKDVYFVDTVDEARRVLAKRLAVKIGA